MNNAKLREKSMKRKKIHMQLIREFTELEETKPQLNHKRKYVEEYAMAMQNNCLSREKKAPSRCTESETTKSEQAEVQLVHVTKRKRGKRKSERKKKVKRYSGHPLGRELTIDFLMSLRDQELVQMLRMKNLSTRQNETNNTLYTFEKSYVQAINIQNIGKKRMMSQKKSKAKGFLAQLFPINSQSEKDKFLRNYQLGKPLKNPNFKYEKKLPNLGPYKEAHFEYLDISKKILDQVILQYDDVYDMFEKIYGPFVSSEDAINYFNYYLETSGINHLSEIMLKDDAASATFCKGTTLCLRTSTLNKYRMSRLPAVANHECGTHLLRAINDSKQVWHKQKKKFNLGGHMQTEEGLACLNTHIYSKTPLLVTGALHYYSVCLAEECDFATLFQKLQKYIKSPVKRWIECIRVKRGTDPKKKGCFAKDQIYLKGAIEILRNRHHLNWRLLYSGKISLEDMEKLEPIASLSDVKLPWFLENEKAEKCYLEQLRLIAQANGIESQG